MTTPAPKRRNKYGAKRTTICGQTFASKKEGMRFILLRQWERTGKIASLTCQPKFDLVVNGQKVGSYKPDFAYVENGAQVCEDVKGGRATITEAAALRMKVFRACYPHLELRIV